MSLVEGKRHCQTHPTYKCTCTKSKIHRRHGRERRKNYTYTQGVCRILSSYVFFAAVYCSILAKQPEGFWNFFCLDTTSISLSLLINISFFVSSFLLPFYLREKKKEGNRKKRRHPASASRRTSNGSGYIYISLYCFHTHTHTHTLSLTRRPLHICLPPTLPPSLSLYIPLCSLYLYKMAGCSG